MSQFIFWNWQDDDSTKHLNHRSLGLHEPGRYRGFDGNVNTPGGLILRLEHTATGVAVTMFDSPTLSIEQRGVLLTKQGVVIQENAALDIPISAGHPLHPRIDLIVCEHEYVDVQFASTAIYYAVQGNPQASPVAPALPPPAQNKTIIGSIYVPAGATALNQPGVVYTPSPVPSPANDPTIMRTNLQQTSTERKTFISTRHPFVQATYTSTGANTGDLVLPTESDSYWLAASGSTNVSYINRIVPPATPTPGHGHRFLLYTERPLLIYFSANIRVPGLELSMVVEAFDIVEFVEITDYNGAGGTPVWMCFKGDEARTNRNQKFYWTQQFNKSVSVVTPQANGIVDLPRFGNYVDVNTTPNSDIKFFPTFDLQKFAPGSGYQEAGTFFFIRITGMNGTIYHNASGVPAGRKPILTPNGQNVTYNGGALLIVIEDVTGWRIFSYTDLLTPFNNVRKLDDLVDVEIYAPGLALGQTLWYNGSAWLNVSFNGLVDNAAHNFSAVQNFNAGVSYNGGAVVAEKIIDIGTWNMDTQTTKDVVHGLTLLNIRSVDIKLRNDAGDRVYDFVSYASTDGANYEIRPTEIRLARALSGFFDSADFDSVAFNRGWIVIKYVV